MNTVASSRLRLPSLVAARMLGVLVAIYLLFGLLNPEAFLTRSNLISISLAASGILILSTGMTVLIVAGQLDLSIGSQLVLSAVVGAAAMNSLDGWPTAPRIAAGAVVSIAVGAVYGAVNGLVTTRLRVPSLIVTLATLGVGLGLAQLLTSAGGSTSYPAPPAMTDFGLDRTWGIPNVVLVSVGVVVIVAFVLGHTRFGLYCFAVGSNREGARRAGVPADRIIVKAFVVMGVLSGIAGLLDIARFSTVSVATHQYDNVTAIAAVIIGGASLYGGRGSVLGTVIGTLIPIVLLQGFVIQGVNTSWQNVAIGVILVVAVAVDHYDRTSRRAKAEAHVADDRALDAVPTQPEGAHP